MTYRDRERDREWRPCGGGGEYDGVRGRILYGLTSLVTKLWPKNFLFNNMIVSVSKGNKNQMELTDIAQMSFVRKIRSLWEILSHCKVLYYRFDPFVLS